VSSSHLEAVSASGKPVSPASQTLVRGLDVLELVAQGPLALSAMARQLGLARSTAHRLANALLERRYLTLVPREGYGLGPKLLELGSLAREQTDLLRLAQPALDRLAAETLETAFLCVPDDQAAVILLRVPGRRRLISSLAIGERIDLLNSAAGQALLLATGEAALRDRAAQLGAQPGGSAAYLAAFLARQKHFAALAYTYDAATSPGEVRSVAAPLRDAAGQIVAAIGLSIPAQHLDEARLAQLGATLCRHAAEIGAALGAALGPRAQKPAQNPVSSTHMSDSGLEAEPSHVHDYSADTSSALKPGRFSSARVGASQPGTIGERSSRNGAARRVQTGDETV
jgi:DNA-binding IclR family transcriptional regulator